jgi:hypothetical protein
MPHAYFYSKLYIHFLFAAIFFIITLLQLVNLISLRPSDKLDLLRLPDTREVSSWDLLLFLRRDLMLSLLLFRLCREFHVALGC